MGFFSRLFGIKPKLVAPAKGGRYVLLRHSPFPRKPIFCVITAVKDGWVSYRLTDESGRPYDCDENDERIGCFLSSWRRVH